MSQKSRFTSDQCSRVNERGEQCPHTREPGLKGCTRHLEKDRKHKAKRRVRGQCGGCNRPVAKGNKYYCGPCAKLSSKRRAAWANENREPYLARRRQRAWRLRHGLPTTEEGCQQLLERTGKVDG